MSRARVLVLLAFAGLVGACNDSPVEPEPEAELTPDLALFGHGVSTQAELQAALDRASESPWHSTIRLDRRAVIELTSTLTHTGSSPLTIDGRGATLIGPDEGNAFSSTGGANLTLLNLTVEAAAEHGIYTEIPASRTGMYYVTAWNVTVRDNGFAGLWIDDQVNDSPAGVSLSIARSSFSGNNTAGLDQTGLAFDEILAFADKDGVRVNEGGLGDLHLFIQGSEFFENQADGVELDETGPGNVYSRVVNSTFDDNGDQLVFPNEVPPGFPDDPDDYEKDLEDGFDIDENDEGSIWASFVNVSANGNEDEGIDLDETFDGSVDMSGTRIVANDNFGAGIQITESEEEPGSDGDIVVKLRNVTANDSRDSRGMRLEEFEAGDVLGWIINGEFDANDGDGLRVESYDDGEIDLWLFSSVFTNNDGDALQAEETGRIVLVNPTFEGNDNDIDDNDGDVEIVQIGG